MVFLRFEASVAQLDKELKKQSQYSDGREVFAILRFEANDARFRFLSVFRLRKAIEFIFQRRTQWRRTEFSIVKDLNRRGRVGPWRKGAIRHRSRKTRRGSTA